MRNNIISFDVSTLAFHKGTNTTIRRFGSGLVPGECSIYSVDEKGNSRFIYNGKITNIQIFAFHGIPDDLFAIHHNCSNEERLLKRMKEYYPDFRENEIIQVISFIPYFNESDETEAEIPF